MPKLTTVPQFLLDMSNEDLKNWNLDDETMEDGTVKPGMITKAVEWGCIDELAAILEETSEKKHYPRVKKVGKKNPNKMTMQADKTQKAIVKVTPLGFFEVKAKFIHEICGLPSIAKPAEPSFRDKILAAAKKAQATTTTAEEKVDAKMKEIFAKK